MPQWLEAARTRVVVFEQEAPEVGLLKDARNRLIVAAGIESALVVTATDMHAEGDARMAVDDGVVHFDAGVDDLVGVVAALAIAFAYLGVEQSGVLGRVDLDIGAAQANQFLDFMPREGHNV